ncbi:hypothetical protein DL95DRAFT_28022 [Leptodontidium sp. 2 PMI_412]|nr:hypothetical protein DL95DRAFT_28022 [Leptodontidium sp. 2 PMI_412]
MARFGLEPEDWVYTILLELGVASSRETLRRQSTQQSRTFASIAVRYIYDHLESYHLVFWISTAQKATLAAARACKELGINFGDSTNELSNAAFVWESWMGQNENWLVVYDNAEDEEVLREFWPRISKGTIIVTSRRPGIARTLVDNELELEVAALSTQESRSLLFKLLPSKYQIASRTKNNALSLTRYVQ